MKLDFLQSWRYNVLIPVEYGNKNCACLSKILAWHFKINVIKFWGSTQFQSRVMGNCRWKTAKLVGFNQLLTHHPLSKAVLTILLWAPGKVCVHGVWMACYSTNEQQYALISLQNWRQSYQTWKFYLLPIVWQSTDKHNPFILERYSNNFNQN